jgi:hypothetical protein
MATFRADYGENDAEESREQKFSSEYVDHNKGS